jgi:hypothetical protein
MAPKPSQVYVIRVWYESSPEGEVWRASVSQGEERHYFATPSSLTAFLKREIEAEEQETPK